MTDFACSKRPAMGSRGMVVTNHPMASAAGAEMLAGGGNAVDAAVASLFALTVAEPMMVGLLGGGMTHLRFPDGRHLVVDGLANAPAASTADQYQIAPDAPPGTFETVGRRNAVGAAAVAGAGALRGWCSVLERFGTMALADVMAPAIRLAEQGFRVTSYLHECTAECAPDLAKDAAMAKVFLPGGSAIAAGSKLVQAEAAASLRGIAQQGPDLLHGGALGQIVADHVAQGGGALRLADLAHYRIRDREPVRGTYRGFEIVGPPPPASSGVHIIQMLNILEGFDLRRLGFGTPASMHLLAEVLKIAFADRAAATADPAFVEVPVEAITSKDYAAERRAAIDKAGARHWTAAVAPRESAHTTHLTVADETGLVVASTQTINSLFGARIMIPGTGLIANNNMFLFDPRPGRTLSIAPGKRVTTSQSPTMVLRDGKPAWALGLPGGLRIFGAVMQALVNLIDHGMDLQHAVEAPRLFDQGHGLELEGGYGPEVQAALRAMGHDVLPVRVVGGGMNAIAFRPEGMQGAACWRADGTPIGLGGGLAAAGIRFYPDVRPG